MTARTPYHFRPMSELDHENEVEMAMRTGQVVRGRLLKGVVGPATRQFMRWHTPTPTDPRTAGWVDATPHAIGWRDPPTSEAIQAWKEAQAA